ncbi:uncharacterized protein [Amphiura filiformis]|uniref:uncharacterized protein n=1 Tax=Amphiura filiformis TaxID=82378 RepID=UPI003B21E1A2
MDVPHRHCWRCEKSLSETIVPCKMCNIAKYCCPKCDDDDKYIHKPECEVWRPKTCGNVGCTTTGVLKECSGCNDAWFCSTTCQQQNWSLHKDVCRQQKTHIKNGAQLLHTKFQTFISSSRPLDMPYYFGNSLPIDMLNLDGNEWDGSCDQPSDMEPLLKNYSILSVGCGNIRNVLYTVVSLPDKFTGKLDITLNDLDPFVLARNVLFLYLMTVYASMDNIALTLTTLWYSLHLTESQYNLIIASLKVLTSISSESLESATGGVVRVSESDLRILLEVWQNWMDMNCERANPESINLRQQRKKMFTEDIISAEGIRVYKQQIPKIYQKSVDDWIQNGVFVPTGFDRRTLTYDNPTLTGRKIGKSPWHIGEALRGDCQTPSDFTFVYCIPTDLWPFGAWDVLQTKDFQTSTSKHLIDPFYRYIASCINETIQFFLLDRIRITLINCDCLKLSDKIQTNHVNMSKSFDRIFTSNVADYVGTRTLLQAMEPLLNVDNKYATIITQYWNWYGLFPESLVDHETHVKDGTNARCLESAQKDTKQKFTMATAPRFWVQEYFNNTKWFLMYLRSDLLACTSEFSSNSTLVKVPSLQEFKSVGNLRMRDFRHEVNRVAPFRYRRNIRPVNMLRGMSRMIEWYIP